MPSRGSPFGTDSFPRVRTVRSHFPQGGLSGGPYRPIWHLQKLSQSALSRERGAGWLGWQGEASGGWGHLESQSQVPSLHFRPLLYLGSPSPHPCCSAGQTSGCVITFLSSQLNLISPSLQDPLTAHGSGLCDMNISRLLSPGNGSVLAVKQKRVFGWQVESALHLGASGKICRPLWAPGFTEGDRGWDRPGSFGGR